MDNFEYSGGITRTTQARPIVNSRNGSSLKCLLITYHQVEVSGQTYEFPILTGMYIDNINREYILSGNPPDTTISGIIINGEYIPKNSEYFKEIIMQAREFPDVLQDLIINYKNETPISVQHSDNLWRFTTALSLLIIALLVLTQL